MIICAIFKHDKIDSEKTLTSRKSLRSDCSIYYEVFVEDSQGERIADIFSEIVDSKKLPQVDIEIFSSKICEFIKLLSENPAIKSQVMGELGLDDNGIVQLVKNLRDSLKTLDPAAVV